MSRLEQLIQELCPNGVEYKKLREVSDMQRGTSLTKAKAIIGNIPVISGGKEPAFYCNSANRDGETITVAGSGAGAGYVQYWDIPIFANDCFTLKGNKLVETKYLYYFMTNIQEKISDTKKGGGVPHVHISDVENFKLPVPPLEVQREIVRILDNFTSLTAELQAELQARKKQYEYYRDELLNFETNIHNEKLKSVAKISRGVRVTKSQLTDNGYPVYQNALIPMGYHSEYNVSGGTTYVISAGAAGEIGFSYENFWAADDCLVFTELNGVTNKYIYHFLMTKKDYIKTRVRKASIPRLPREVIENLLIPTPSIEIQNKIVDILDNFEKICSDLNIGLPAEIEARQKQYEYYRDALLSFDNSYFVNVEREREREMSGTAD